MASTSAKLWSNLRHAYITLNQWGWLWWSSGFVNVCQNSKQYWKWTSSFSFTLSPGWLHVHPRWSSEHSWEQENWLIVQDLAYCAQPVGAMLGEAPQGLSTPDFSPQHAAAKHGAHAGAHWTTEISTDGTDRRTEGLGRAGQRGDEVQHGTEWNSRQVLG